MLIIIHNEICPITEPYAASRLGSPGTSRHCRAHAWHSVGTWEGSRCHQSRERKTPSGRRKQQRQAPAAYYRARLAADACAFHTIAEWSLERRRNWPQRTRPWIK